MHPVDNGSEFISKEVDLRAYPHGVALDFSRLGKPRNNAFIESSNSRFRQECLMSTSSEAWDYKQEIETWARHYIEQRHHSSLGYQSFLG